MKIGETVIYKLTEHDVQVINKRRNARGGDFNDVQVGEVYPAIVVRAFSDSANLHVLLDGLDTHWAVSRSEGQAGGQYTRVE